MVHLGPRIGAVLHVTIQLATLRDIWLHRYTNGTFTYDWKTISSSLLGVFPLSPILQRLKFSDFDRIHSHTMKLFTLSVVVAGLTNEAAAQIKTVSAVRCFTKLGSSSRAAPIPTVNKILTLPVYSTRKSTSTPTVTVTPPPVLVTSTE